MGIDLVVLEALFLSQASIVERQKMITLGRQGVHIPKHVIDHISKKYNWVFGENVMTTRFCEEMFHQFGFATIESIDASSYEQATIVHDMNFPLPTSLKDQFDFVFDGGTIEHIFNLPQVLENVIDMLKVGGVFCSVTCNNNFSGHGMYQFSPELFLSTLNKKYGMELIHLFIAEVDTEKESWINVNSYTSGRNETMFKSTTPVYIVTVARKISADRKSLLLEPAQQFSYEQQSWLHS